MRVLPLFYFSLIFAYLYQVLFRSIGYSSSVLAFNFFQDFSIVLKNLLFIRGDEIFWTIGVEISFYLLFPVFWFFSSCFSNKNKNIGALLLVIVFFYLCQQYTDGGNYLPVNIGRLNLHITYFLLGLIAYVIFDFLKGTYKHTEFNKTFNVIWVLSVGIIVISLPFSQRELFQNASFYDYKSLWLTNYTMMFGVGMFIAISPLSSTAFYVLGNKYMAFCGGISYSIYLLHRYPLRAFTFIRDIPDVWKSVVFFLVLLPMVIIIAYLGYKYVEKPCQRFMLRHIQIKSVVPPLKS